MISTAWALETTLRLVAFSILIQALEMIRIRSAWTGSGPWAWNRIRDEFRAFGRAPFFALDLLLSDRGFALLVLSQIVAGLGCIVLPNLAWAPALFVTALLQSIRWRGVFNGGSDYMTILVLLALTVASCFDYEAGAVPALAYIGIQVLASYFIAGVVKIKEPEWRNGRALRAFLASAREGAPTWVGALSSIRVACALGAWGVILFELLAPLVLLASGRPLWAFIVLGIAFVFHLANAVIFGLNRFVWAWLAGYPGVLWISGLEFWSRFSS
jgi:hypothetical protein